MKQAHILTIVLFMFSFIANAQDVLVPLKENAALQNAERTRTLHRLPTVELPFLDDFYPSDIYPDEALWMDDLVYINANYAVEPPTIGVATFDGLNASGAPYSIVTKAYGVADILTSMPINLAGLTNTDDVYLSFFYQPQGIGESPDFDLGDTKNQDYFIVEFKDTASNWDTLMTIMGDTNQAFKQEFIKIETAYLHGDFQMRFKSVGRLTGAFDHWHLDYVKVDRNRDPIIEANIPEMAYQYWPTPLLSPYYVMPYNQFDSTYITDTHSVFIRNNFIQATTDIQDFYTATVVNTGATLDSYVGPSRDIGPLLSFKEDYDSFAIPENLTDDTVIIRVDYSFDVSVEDTLDVVSARNNRIIKDQVFSNFLAYDDGSAERGYILQPERGDALYGRTLLKYNVKQADTLQAIKIKFVNFIEELNVPNNANFSIYVWKSIESDSTEEELLYQRDFIDLEDLPLGDSAFLPNKFSFIPIDSAFIVGAEEHIIVEGDFYIGIGVEIDQTLTIGFDLNTDGSENHFYTFGLGWFRTQNTGSLMMNPVLGSTLPDQYVTTSTNETVIAQLGFDLFPNPVNSHLKVESSIQKGQIEIIDMLGRLIYQKGWNQSGVLDVNELKSGMYLLRLTDQEKGITGTKQFIKQ